VQKRVTSIIFHIAASHRQLSLTLKAKRDTAARLAEFVQGIPDTDPGFLTVEAIIEHAQHLTKSVAAYLNSLADLEDALALQTEIVLKEMNVIPDNEE
jgi:hypothetical protein